ncbi:MAG: ATP synthase F1 subunit delta [Armatimonadetes bacterium]|nr:ATP synthase F1 subunit delta [Armatimonadota bacterium]
MVLAASQSGKKYVEGLVQAAVERDKVEEVRISLRRLQDTVESVPQLVVALSHPELADDEKIEILNEVAADDRPALVAGFLDLIVRDGQTGVLQHVADLYHQLYDELRGVQHALVETPIPLSDSQKQRLHMALEKIIGGQVSLEEQINPELLGGLRIFLGHRVIDVSLQGRLEALRQAVG